jgi:Mor family transcriptional regulator
MEQTHFYYYILPFKSFQAAYFNGIKLLLPFKQSLKDTIHQKSIFNSF